jgi:hypothetical protein
MNRRLVGLGIAAAGGGLLFLGLRAQDALGSRFFEVFSGRPSDEALAMLGGGALLLVLGLGILFKRAKKD